MLEAFSIYIITELKPNYSSVLLLLNKYYSIDSLYMYQIISMIKHEVYIHAYTQYRYHLHFKFYIFIDIYTSG